MNIKCSDYKSASMQILLHHVYEYKKGLRNLVLHTLSAEHEHLVHELLQRKEIAYVIRPVNARKINVFFGHTACVSIIKSFGSKPLNEYSHEQDFILGTMLGYDGIQQCDRYLKRKNSMAFDVKEAS